MKKSELEKIVENRIRKILTEGTLDSTLGKELRFKIAEICYKYQDDIKRELKKDNTLLDVIDFGVDNIINFCEGKSYKI